MPRLDGVIDRLGLVPDVVEDVARHGLLASRRALAQVDPEGAPPEAVDFVTTRGLRALGLVALVDGGLAAGFGSDLGRWLALAGHPAWPLAHAFLPRADVPGLRVEGPAPVAGYPFDLLMLALGRFDRDPGPDEPARSRWGRGALAPFRLDLRLLAALVRGGTTTEPGRVSEPSAPAVAAVLLGSLEDALEQQRDDETHWRIGAGRIAATDPEVVLTVRALLGSPVAWATAPAAQERPLVGAVASLVDERGLDR
ncbi:hypothetical protein [Cellulomonas endophytica]|uniref:hypothetical protein n=1 Tax=Cellulomonas endophytica TaxID=2494735 RepID=UPI0010136D55|nr:hypothetical protein [Cellulomonas endophytica]